MVGAVSIGLLTMGFASASSQAQEAEFRNGTAKATAIALRVAPGIGSLQLALAAGVGVAEYRNNFAQAQAESLDLGLVGSVLTAPSGCTGRSILPAGVLPEPVRVDNREGDATVIGDALPLAGSNAALGHGEVHATTKPSSTAKAQPAIIDLAPIIKVDTLVAESTTQVLDGNTREAHATVEASITLLGALKLSGLRWDALHRTGAQTVADATFDLGTQSLIGLPVPLDALGDAQTALNNVLAPVGLSIEFPRKEHITEPVDLVRMTPLRIQIKDSPLGGQVVGPLLNLSREQREQAFTQIATSICELAGVPLVADIGLAIVGGTGFLTIDIGGAEATTSDFEEGNPFGDDEPLVGPVVDAPLPTLPTVPGSFAAPVITGAPPQEQAIADVGPLRDRCESFNTVTDTACSEGALLAAGLLGLVATAGVGALDWRHQRKRRATLEVPA